MCWFLIHRPVVACCRDNAHLKRELELLRQRHTRQQRVLNKVHITSLFLLSSLPLNFSLSLYSYVCLTDCTDYSVPDSHGVQGETTGQWQERKTVSKPLFLSPCTSLPVFTPYPPLPFIPFSLFFLAVSSLSSSPPFLHTSPPSPPHLPPLWVQ